MTTTTAPLTIPATGLIHNAGDVIITVLPTAQCGYQLQVRVAGAFHHGEHHVFETHALTAWAALVAKYPAPPVQRLAPAAKGTATKVSDPQHTALVVAAMVGRVERGGQVGQASVKTLAALARRGYLALTYETGRRDARKVVTGGVLTGPGRIRLGQLTSTEREAAEFTARLALALNVTAPTLIAA